MKRLLIVSACLSVFLGLARQGYSAPRDITPDQLQQALKRFPAADTNKDGKLSPEEAAAYLRNRKKGDAPATPEAAPTKNKGTRIEPTQANVKYGPHERNVFDFWQAKSKEPAPLVVFIHGGGFVSGDKSALQPEALKRALDSGSAVMAINYRFRQHAAIQDILRDAARSIQFVRLNAEKFNIDPKRIASFGGSAGAGTSLWLATHDDLANPKADDPVLRQSSRIVAAAAMNPQATYDLPEWERIVYPFKPEWKKADGEATDFYRVKDLESADSKKIMADCSMYSLLTKDDAPIWMSCTQPDGEPKDRGHLLHHPKHVRVIEEKAKGLGVPVEARFGASERSNISVAAVDFLLKHLAPVKKTAAAVGQ